MSANMSNPISNFKPASKKLVRLAKKTARLQFKAAQANLKWVDGFRKEYGHDDIPDALVEAIDYSSGNVDMLTADFIGLNSMKNES